MNQNMLTWLAGNQEESNGPPCCLRQNPQMSPLLPQSDYTVSFKSVKARTSVESRYLAKPEVLRHISELWVLELTSKSNDCHNQIKKQIYKLCTTYTEQFLKKKKENIFLKTSAI